MSKSRACVFFYRLLPPLLDPGFFLGANVDAGVVGAAKSPPAGAAGVEPNRPPEGAGAAGAGATIIWLCQNKPV